MKYFDQNDLRPAVAIIEEAITEIEYDEFTGPFDRMKGKELLADAIEYIIMSNGD